MKTGRPVENPAARYGTTPVHGLAGRRAAAHNWHPMAFSPQTGLVYFPVSETYMAYAARRRAYDPRARRLGTSFTGDDAEREGDRRIRRRRTREGLAARPGTR